LLALGGKHGDGHFAAPKMVNACVAINGGYVTGDISLCGTEGSALEATLGYQLQGV